VLCVYRFGTGALPCGLAQPFSEHGAFVSSSVYVLCVCSSVYVLCVCSSVCVFCVCVNSNSCVQRVSGAPCLVLSHRLENISFFGKIFGWGVCACVCCVCVCERT